MLRNRRVRGITALLALSAILSSLVSSAGAVQTIAGVSTIPAAFGVELAATIDVNPINSSNIAMSGNFGGAGCSPVCTTYFPDWFSRDAGSTWLPGSIPGSQWSNYFIDPAGIFDSNGNYYIGNLINTTGSFGVTLLKSTDGGATFNRLPWTWLQSTNYLLPNGTYAHVCPPSEIIPTGAPFPYDLPRIFADKSTGSAYRGNLYFTNHIWLETKPGECAPGFLGFESSSDGGMTWNNLQAFNLTYTNTYGASWPISVSYNGTIYISGEFGSACGKGSGIALFKSTNGGSSFNAKCVYTPYHLSGRAGPIPIGNGVAIAASPASDNFIDMVFSACPGATYSSCINSKTSAYINGTHVYSLSSNDGGNTWTGPIRIDDTLPNDYVQDPFGRVTVGIAPNDRVDATWFDFRNSNGNNTLGDIYFSYSSDLARTFSQNTRLTSQTSFICTTGWNYPPAVCTAGNEFMGLSSLTNMAYVAFDTFAGSNVPGAFLYQYFSQVSFTSSSVGGMLLSLNSLARIISYIIAASAGIPVTLVYFSWRKRRKRADLRLPQVSQEK